MTDPEPRRIGLDRALEEFDALLAKWGDEQPVDIDVLTHLAVYTKERP